MQDQEEGDHVEKVGENLDQQHGLQKRFSAFETKTGERIGSKRCHCRAQNRDDNGDEQRIDVPTLIRMDCAGQQLPIVIQRRVLRNQWLSHQGVGWIERRRDDPDDWKEREDQHDDSQHDAEYQHNPLAASDGAN